jgi:hypothetical protein
MVQTGGDYVALDPGRRRDHGSGEQAFSR